MLSSERDSRDAERDGLRRWDKSGDCERDVAGDEERERWLIIAVAEMLLEVALDSSDSSRSGVPERRVKRPPGPRGGKDFLEGVAKKKQCKARYRAVSMREMKRAI